MSDMTLNEYQRLAARTINPELTKVEQVQHSLHGLSAEVGELNGLYQKFYQGHAVDPKHAKKEAGDIAWMLAEYCTVSGTCGRSEARQKGGRRHRLDAGRILYGERMEP